MKEILTLLTFFFLTICYSQNDKFNVSHGVNLIPLDTLNEKTLEIKFQNCFFVAFPQNYSQKIYGMKKIYFVPDSTTISYINQNIAKQYCYSSYRFMDNFYKNALKDDDGSDKDYTRGIKKNYKKFKRNKLKNCQKYENDINQFDKQLIGFINEKGEKIILIQMIDFKDDPYELKPLFKFAWINGWHGWFETNIKRLHFHLKNNKFTINEDI